MANIKQIQILGALISKWEGDTNPNNLHTKPLNQIVGITITLEIPTSESLKQSQGLASNMILGEKINL